MPLRKISSDIVYFNMANSLEKTIKRISEPFAKLKPASILYNRYVLYLVFALVLSNLFVSAVHGDYLFITYFILIGFVMSFFSKNMTVILVLTLGVANVLKLATRSSAEGFVESKETDEDKEEEKGKKKGKDATESTPKKQTKGEMVETIKTDAEKLIEAQKHIIDGFEKIDPYMKQAEGLIGEIDETAKKIEKFNSEVRNNRNA